MKKALIFPIVSAILLCGCSDTERPSDSSGKSIIVVDSPSEESSSESSTESVSAERSSESFSAESSSYVEPPFEEKYPTGLTSLGTVWDYPFGESLSYDFASGSIIRELEKRYGLTGEEQGFEGEWCALVLSILLYENGYDIEYQYTPCDLAIELLDDGYAHFYCLRQENYDSLVYWGLENTDRVINTSREEFVPKRGDFICYLWTEEAEEYNWSHIGMVAEDYDGTVLRTIEGNIGKGRDPLYHAVEARERYYDETVIGFIRLD